MSNPSPPAFHDFDESHIAVILLTFALPGLLSWIAQKSKSGDIRQTICNGLALLLIGNYMVLMVDSFMAGRFDLRSSLPMQLCDWALFATVIALLTRSLYFFEPAYFWGLAGTLQAIITPDLRSGYPSFTFFTFFINHSGIVTGILFMLISIKLRPRLLSLIRVMLWSEIYFISALLVNSLTGANYGFLTHKPASVSLLDLMSKSRPVYLIELNLLAVVYFACLYLPFLFYDRISRRDADLRDQK